MIHDLDDTIKELLVQRVPIDLNTIDIQFERPEAEWEARLTKPTINCFLYDIRENLPLRFDQQVSLTRNGTTGQERLEPRRIDIKYLITVWSQIVANEHQLLGRIMQTLLAYSILPTEVLQGEMVNQSLPIRAWTAQPEHTPNTWDFWGANEWRLKAGISYIVTIAVEPFAPTKTVLATETVFQLLHKETSDN